MNVSKFFIERPRFAMVISVLITLCGGIAIFTLPIALYPEIAPPQVGISASYPGASADVVQKTIIAPIEAQVNGVKHMLYMSSSAANDGSAQITVTFEPGSNNDLNTVNVKNRVALAEPGLPAVVRQNGLSVKENSTNMLAVVTLYSPDGTYDDKFLVNYAMIHINDRLARVQGVGEVMTFGEPYSLRVWLDPERLASLKMSPKEVVAAIEEQNVQVAAGQVGGAPTADAQQFQYTVQLKGRLDDVADFKEIIVRSDNGSDVRLKDVARVEMGMRSYDTYATFNGRRCAAIAIYQLPGANAVSTMDKVKEALVELSARFPKDLNYDMSYDTTSFIKLSIKELVETLLIAVLLVIGVVYLFLQDWRATMIPAITVPVSLIGTFAAMKLVGFTINTTTLFGLILAIGIVVDDAIIVVENVFRLMHDEGLDPKAAAIKTMDQVSGPVVSTTMVLLSVFIPVSFLPGISGELYRQFALTIAFSVAISTLNALTLSPALCGVFLPMSEKQHHGLFGIFNRFFGWLTGRYCGVSGFFARKLLVAAALFLALVGGAYVIYLRLPTGFIPAEDNGFVLIDVQLPDDASLPRTAILSEKVADIVRAIPGVANTIAVNGYSMMNSASVSNSAFVIAILKDWKARKGPGMSQDAILGQIYMRTQVVPSAQIIPFALPAIPGVGNAGGFEFVLQSTMSDKPRDLAAALGTLLGQANQSPELQMVFSTYRANVPQLFLDVDREKVKTLGVNLGDVFSLLQSTLGTTYVNDFNKFGRVYQVRVQADADHRRFLQDIGALHVMNAKGKMVPLDTLLTVSSVFGPQVIQRYNMFPAATINGSVAPGRSSGEGMKVMEKLANDLPEGMSFEWTGMSYQELLAGGKSSLIFALCVVFAYLFLVALYESWMLPFAVMLAVPLAFLGALGGLWIAKLDNNIYTQIGFVLLIGLAAKTAILIVEFAMMEREEGKSAVDAAIHASRLRFRAICMTSLAFILGVLPLVVATGAGAAGRRAMGTTVFAGMICAGLLATVIIPSFYVSIQNVRDWNRGFWAGKGKHGG